MANDGKAKTARLCGRTLIFSAEEMVVRYINGELVDISTIFHVFAGWYDAFMTLSGLSNERLLLQYIGDVAGLRIADVGGGTGTLAALLAERDGKVTVIDPCAPMTGIARRKNRHIEVINAYAENIPVEANTFDMTCMRDCLHHMEGQGQALREAVRILKPHGVVIIQEFNPESYIAQGIALFEKMLGEKTKLIRPTELVNTLRDLGVRGQVHRLRGFEYVFVGYKFMQV